MNIQIFSDLHLDVASIKPITIVDSVELVIVAGDTCEGAPRAFEQLRQIVPQSIPIVMVLGNHEYYHHVLPVELALAREQAAGCNIHLLENASVIIGGVRFLGATLWTDYALFGAAHVPAVMDACADGLNDHRLIGWQKQPWQRFRPLHAGLLHRQSRVFLEDLMATPFAGPTVVVSHHAPHWNSVHPRYRSDPVTGAFASDLSALIESYQPDLWVHGHVHHSSDYHVDLSRVIANPHGYGVENPDFNGALTVEMKP